LKGLEAAILDSTEVNENIGSVFSFDKAEAFLLVKPLDFSIHRLIPPFLYLQKADYDDGIKKPPFCAVAILHYKMFSPNFCAFAFLKEPTNALAAL